MPDDDRCRLTPGLPKRCVKNVTHGYQSRFSLGAHDAIGRRSTRFLTCALGVMQTPTLRRPIGRPLQLSLTFGSLHGPSRSHSHGCAR
ncbi:MAG: hypothetical protein GY820_41370 [Gammaproteobacteria bacterium]|nr:hypothetical protein [Gammaproteobacteria bacterium]